MALGDTDLCMYASSSPRCWARRESEITAGALEIPSGEDLCILFGDDEESVLSFFFTLFTFTLKNKLKIVDVDIKSFGTRLSYQCYLFNSQEISNMFGKLLTDT